VTAHRCGLRNILLACQNQVKDGLVVEDARLFLLENVSIVRAIRRGLYLHAVSGLCGNGHIRRLEVYMPNDYGTPSTDLRGVVLEGEPPYGVTVNCFYDVMTNVKGVATSYGVDFARSCDQNIFYGLRAGFVDSPITAGVIFNSYSPDTDAFVRNNVVFHFLSENSTNPQVIANKADVPNYVYQVSYDVSPIYGIDLNVIVDRWRRPFVYETSFESLDGFWCPVVGGTASIGAEGVVLSTGAVAGNNAELLKFPTPPFVTTDHYRYFTSRVQFVTVTAQEVRVASGPNRTPTDHHFGFKLVDGVLYGSVADGTTEATLDLGVAITAGQNVTLHAELFPGIEARFYVDGDYRGRITTNLPTADFHFLVSAYISTTEAVDKRVKLTYFKLVSS